MQDLGTGLIVVLVSGSITALFCWWMSRGIKTWDQVQKECDLMNKEAEAEWEKLPDEKKRDPKYRPLKWEPW